jgi:hypothetical protein
VTSTQQKIDMANRAIEEIQAAETKLARAWEAQNKAALPWWRWPIVRKLGLRRQSSAQVAVDKANATRDATYHLCAFLALLGSLEQFLLKDANYNDPDNQFIYNFRRLDAHYAAGIGLRIVDVHTELISPSGLIRITVTEYLHFGSSPRPPAAPDPLPSIYYRITEPQIKGFMRRLDTKTNTWIDWPMRAGVIALLPTTSAVELCTKALNFYENTVLPKAAARGAVTIP